ncbi:uncharacterized protein LOC120370930 [Mauremys reevesii]|uniref:uncharacterized protein LOC120370930 n=1 Tax=Mauremys reevesii TaxID=260615 RepID=UPI00193F0E36|nr:uncharacterized protein LOC120370930 [Mauremys reevesii]
MVTLGTIIPALDQGDWFTALDLQDTYFHISIHPAHRRFLRFTIGHDHFQYRVLPFRLSTALRVFSKTLAMVVAHVRKHGIMLFPYLDDCLIKGNSYGETLQATHFTISLFHSLGLQINIQNSTLTPTQQIEFIGAHLNSIQSRASLPYHRFLTITQLICTLSIHPRTQARICLQLLGHMAATTFLVQRTRLQMRCLQGWLNSNFKPNRQTLGMLLTPPPNVIASLHWWTRPENLCMGVSFQQRSPNAHAHHRHFPNRLGSAPRGTQGTRIVVCIRDTPTHKSLRAQSRETSLPSLSSPHKEQISSCLNRQHSMHVLHKQTRGSPITFPLHGSRLTMELVHTASNTNHCFLPTRLPQHYCRRT